MEFKLKPRASEITDYDLLKDLERVSELIGKTKISRDEYEQYGKYKSHLFKRFGGWSKALESIGLGPSNHRNVSDEELLDDIVNVAKKLGVTSLTQDLYNQVGKFSAGAVKKRWGWNIALVKAGLDVSRQAEWTDEDCFMAIEEVWIKKNGQPTPSDMKKFNSQISYGTIKGHFNGWRNALEMFERYKNDPTYDMYKKNKSGSLKESSIKEKNVRNVSLITRLLVLARDGSTCVICGRSVKCAGVQLHVDHIIPISKGGTNEISNLRTLCEECNLGKGDLMPNQIFVDSTRTDEHKNSNK